MREGISEMEPGPLPITKISFEAEVGGVTVAVQLGGDAKRMHAVQEEIGYVLIEMAQRFAQADSVRYGCDRCDPDGTVRSGGEVTVKNGHSDGMVGAAFGSSFDNV